MAVRSQEPISSAPLPMWRSRSNRSSNSAGWPPEDVVGAFHLGQAEAMDDHRGHVELLTTQERQQGGGAPRVDQAGPDSDVPDPQTLEVQGRRSSVYPDVGHASARSDGRRA